MPVILVLSIVERTLKTNFSEMSSSILIYYQAIESISRSDLAEMIDLQVATMMKKTRKMI
jgi:hypothetical protein